MTGEDAARIVQSIEFVLDNKDYSDEVKEAIDMAVKALRQLPNDDENYVVLWEKAQWERDVAVEQLEQLGYTLGEKIRISEDCISREATKKMLTEEWTKYMPMELDINLSFVMEKINELPSVVPSYNSIKTELKPSEDCISRVQALHACCDEWDKDYKAIMKSIRRLPSVTPKAESEDAE